MTAKVKGKTWAELRAEGANVRTDDPRQCELALAPAPESSPGAPTATPELGMLPPPPWARKRL